MANNKDKYAGSAQKNYDSDSDLSPADQKKIREAHRPETKAKLRKEGWNKAPAFSKIKKMFSDKIYGDTRKKD